MVSALISNYHLVSQHGNAKSSVWQYFGKLHHDYVDDIFKYWSVQSSSNNMPILCQLAELYMYLIVALPAFLLMPVFLCCAYRTWQTL